jgi:hypothetical protein
MNRLYIEQTKATPEIDLNPTLNLLKVKGQSYPENAFKFYEPIFNWIDEFLLQSIGAIAIEIQFEMPYINSSSSKCIMMMLEKFDEAYTEGKNVIINWHYDPENESSLECAEEFKDDLTLPFNLVETLELGG